MCGICGVVTLEANHPLAATDRLIQMRDTMIHRGPDDSGLFRAEHVALAHRRLSIIDLSSGAQPMASGDKKLWVLNNGEIYNYRELSKELELRGHRFHTQSDTEAIIYAYREYGVKCLDHLRGMFALAVWDVERQRLFLARDRAGQKPLYYAVTPEGIQFASELKALLVDDTLPRDINPQAVADYLTYTNVPTPLTIFKGISKLPPAHALTYSITGDFKVWRYWSWNRLTSPPTNYSYPEAVDALRYHIEESVQMRLVSDVPLGVLLSGGVDSATIAAMVARQRQGSVKTFTIGFLDSAYDESDAASETAKHLGTDHHVQILEPESIEDIVPKLALQYDEPFGDSSALPTYYVCKMAQQDVTVALAGDGGDEVFGGYWHYAHMMQLSRYLDPFPFGLRKAVLAPVLSLMHEGMRGKRTLERLQLPPVQRHQAMMTLFSPREQVELLRPEWQIMPRQLVAEQMRSAEGSAYLNAMQHSDFNVFLPEDILVKVDRASMLNSLEVRSPLLDHKLLEFAATLPADWVFRKRILKDAICGLVPDSVLSRPKKGFGVPLHAWFKGNCQNYLREVLLSPNGTFDEVFSPDAVKSLLRQARSRFGRVSGKIWTLLMFKLWAQTYAG